MFRRHISLQQPVVGDSGGEAKEAKWPGSAAWAVVVVSYHTARTVSIVRSHDTVEKRVARGCLHGSILGADLWNLNFNSLMKTLDTLTRVLEMDYASYEGDLAVVVRASSRQDLKTKGHAVMDRVLQWFGSTGFRCLRVS